MFFLKNLRTWESIARILVGIALVPLGFMGFQSPLLGRMVAATGAVLLLTGLVGWCPMCAMVGRKLS